jgi:hypothetical protein
VAPKSWPHLRIRSLSRGGSGGHCRYPADWVPLHTSFKSRQVAGHAPTWRHVLCSTESCLPAKVGYGAAMCAVASDPASLIGMAPAPSRVPWLWTPPPYRGGLWCTTCHTSPDPPSLQGRAPERHVSHDSRSCLSTGRAPVSPPHALWFPVGRRPQA